MARATRAIGNHYDSNDNRIRMVHPDGSYLTYEHDGLDRPTLVRENGGAPVASVAYHPGGRRASSGWAAVISYTYDLNRVTQKSVPAAASGAAGYSVHYGYDAASALQLYARFGSATGAGITTAYDRLGRPVSSTNDMGGASRALGYQYDAGGRRSRLTLPDGNYFTYDYDAAGKLTAIRENGGTAIASFGYDSAGRPQTKTLTGAVESYAYDPVSRLSDLGLDLAGTASDLSLGFSYSPASQMVSRTSSNDSYAWTGAYNVSRAYSVNGLNQYTAAGPAAFAYDGNGNLTSDGSTGFVYDAENRLVSASGGRNATLAYDPLGRLFQTTGGGVTTQFLYDGDELVAEYDGAGTLLRRYAHGIGSDDPVVWYEGSGLTDRRNLLANHQGSVIAVANAAGDGSRYTGQAWLAELGMFYYKARIYSPTLGRFLQVDPIGYDDQINLYAYVGNDPVNRRDPTGRYQCGESAKKEDGRGVTGCQQFEKFRKEVEAYAKSLRRETRTAESGRELSRVNRILKAIGTLDDGNNVTVETVALKRGTPAASSLDEKTGAITLKVDLPQIADRVAEGRSGGGVSTLHEGSHIVDLNDFGNPRNRSQCLAFENRAYQTQNGMSQFQGTGVVDVKSASEASCGRAN